MNSLILVDGPKGGGKTTVWRLLKDRFPNNDFLSLDEIRSEIRNPGETIADANKRATKELCLKIEESLKSGKITVVDSGLTSERLSLFESIAKEVSAPVFKYELTTSPEILLGRIRERDSSRGKETDEQRFWQTYALQQKPNAQFRVFDTEKATPEEIVSQIVKESRLE